MILRSYVMPSPQSIKLGLVSLLHSDERLCVKRLAINFFCFVHQRLLRFDFVLSLSATLAAAKGVVIGNRCDIEQPQFLHLLFSLVVLLALVLSLPEGHRTL